MSSNLRRQQCWLHQISNWWNCCLQTLLISLWYYKTQMKRNYISPPSRREPMLWMPPSYLQGLVIWGTLFLPPSIFDQTAGVERLFRIKMTFMTWYPWRYIEWFTGWLKSCMISSWLNMLFNVILGSRPASERRRYYVTTSLIDWT